MTRRKAIASLALAISNLAAARLLADSKLELVDLPAYRAALTESNRPKTPPSRVTFRDLWFRGAEFEGKFVQVEGRLARRFHQPPFGTFPSLTEAWLISPAGDPFCVVFPDEKGIDLPKTGTLQFAGMYLKKVRYEGGDAVRGAPLIVGSQPPKAGAQSPAAPAPRKRSNQLDWAIALGALVVFVAVMFNQYARRPRRRPAPPTRDEPLQFLAPEGTTSTDSEGQSASSAEADRLRGEV
ncbi:hypothetical protein [Singulisphaera sp. PoT]|uniref:hypothetical protein n=1 Tax=Singulisphaera sp. PoT TaxID=3411797 RepID=UPI003BF5C370